MASFTAGTTFVDGVSNDVTAAKLGALVTNATPTSGFIQDRTAETITATNDTLLIGDASDSNNLKRITVANFAQTLPTAKVTTGTIDTGTFGTTTSTAATITALTAGTTTSTAATITTGTIPTLVATTLITTGAGSAAAPAIVPTGDTNTGIFFPAADTIAFSEGGAEAMRIDSSGNVGIGTTSSAAKLHVYSANASDKLVQFGPAGISDGNFITTAKNGVSGSTSGTPQFSLGMDYSTTYTDLAALKFARGGGAQGNILFFTGNAANGAERLRIDVNGNVGIGTESPDSVLSVYANNKTTPAISARYSAAGIKAGLSVYNSLGFPYLSFKANPVSGSDNATYDISAAASKIDFATSSGSANIVFSNAASGTAGSTISWSERLRIDSSGNVGIGVAAPVNRLEVVGSFGRGAPVTKTGDFTLADTENWLIVNKGSSCTVTLPAASSWTGREFTIKVITAHTVVSASSNIIPRSGGAATTAILLGVDGAWATLVSNGTNWEIMCGS